MGEVRTRGFGGSVPVGAPAAEADVSKVKFGDLVVGDKITYTKAASGGTLAIKEKRIEAGTAIFKFSGSSDDSKKLK